MWKLESEKDGIRLWRNPVTNSECKQRLCYTDKEGNTWHEFVDLITLPFTRSFAATKITSLYTLGLTHDDVNKFFAEHKATLKSKDTGEKYEKAYAEVLELESKFKSASDPLRQMSSLVCVYFTINDEPIDSFNGDLQLKKMLLLEADVAMHNFFLKRQIFLIENFNSTLNLISQTALENLNGQ